MRHDSQSAKLDFPIDSRLRGNDGRFCKGLPKRERRCGGTVLFTLTFDSSPIKGEGDSVGCFGLLLPCSVDTALKPVRACATVVSSRYSAWHVPSTSPLGCGTRPV